MPSSFFKHLNAETVSYLASAHTQRSSCRDTEQDAAAPPAEGGKGKESCCLQEIEEFCIEMGKKYNNDHLKRKKKRKEISPGIRFSTQSKQMH